MFVPVDQSRTHRQTAAKQRRQTPNPFGALTRSHQVNRSPVQNRESRLQLGSTSRISATRLPAALLSRWTMRLKASLT